mgnify:FL=1
MEEPNGDVMEKRLAKRVGYFLATIVVMITIGLIGAFAPYVFVGLAAVGVSALILWLLWDLIDHMVN